MNRKQFIRLLRKYREGTATGEESRFIESYYALYETEAGAEAEGNAEGREAVKSRIREGIWNEIGEGAVANNKRGIKLSRMSSIRAAAAIAALAATSLVIYLGHNRHTDEAGPMVTGKTEALYKEEIRPGGNVAVLTLANGRKISLDSTSGQIQLQQGGVDIKSGDKGELLYQHTDAYGKVEQYNTITIPRGGQYKIILSDGTKVWLNAGSTLHYPVAFVGQYRQVELTGEGYFEVAQNTRQPFLVKANGTEIQVLGTHFNVNAYEEEENVKTTLASGSVRIRAGRKSRVLKPGEQANADGGTGWIQVGPGGVEEALAWKDGLFYFDDTNIKTIMQEVARWYDVQVVYRTEEVENKNFNGIVSRYSDVNALLKRMELTGTVHFKVEGRQIVVMD